MPRAANPPAIHFNLSSSILYNPFIIYIIMNRKDTEKTSLFITIMDLQDPLIQLSPHFHLILPLAIVNILYNFSQTIDELDFDEFNELIFLYSGDVSLENHDVSEEEDEYNHPYSAGEVFLVGLVVGLPL